jgi:hypothetical protein
MILMNSRISKVELIVDIASMLGIAAPKVSTGSTEPKELFILINDLLGLAIPTNLQKPAMAQQIVELSGGTWTTECESTGGTVTNLGLEKVRDAVSFFTRSEKGIN